MWLRESNYTINRWFERKKGVSDNRKVQFGQVQIDKIKRNKTKITNREDIYKYDSN